MRETTIDKYHAPQWLGDRATRRFHVMAKPAGSACNLGCSYCFYLSKEKLAGGPGPGHMHDDVLEAFIRDYIGSATGDEVVFSWQGGGEPTLLGIPFFEKVVVLQRKHAKPGQRIANDLQTNGTLLDEDWAKFLKGNRFLVGLSVDGPKDIHDAMRPTKRGQPSFDDVMRGWEWLRRYQVPFNTLTCVHRYNAKRPLDVYRFLRRELGSTYVQFIPIVEPRNFETTAPGHGDASQLPVVGSPPAAPDHPLSVVTPWSVDPDEYGYFLSKVWDEWISRDLGKVLVNFCETLVAQRMGMPSQVCIYAEKCGKGVAIDPQVFDLWQDPQERYDIFMNNYTERTWTLVTISEEIKNLMKTYVQYPPRKMQSMGYDGPVELSKYEQFQWLREKLQKDGVSIPLPVGN